VEKLEILNNAKNEIIMNLATTRIQL